MPQVRCPQCGAMVELIPLGPEVLVGTCDGCGVPITAADGVVPGQRLRSAAQSIGKVLFAVSALPLLVVWLYFLFGWVGLIGAIAGLIVFPSVYLAPFAILVVKGASTFALVALGLWVANLAGVVLMRLSDRD